MRAKLGFIQSHWLGLALGLVLILVADNAFASDCDLRLSSFEVDYGPLNRSEMDIRGNAPIDLGARQLTLTAVCRQATTLGLRFAGEAADSGSYRFAGKGRFTIKLINPTLDGNAVQLVRSTRSAGGATAPVAMMELRPNEGVAVIAQGRRAVGKVFSAQVEIQTYVDEVSTRTRDVTTLEGRGALTLETD